MVCHSCPTVYLFFVGPRQPRVLFPIHLFSSLQYLAMKCCDLASLQYLRLDDVLRPIAGSDISLGFSPNIHQLSAFRYFQFSL